MMATRDNRIIGSPAWYNPVELSLLLERLRKDATANFGRSYESACIESLTCARKIFKSCTNEHQSSELRRPDAWMFTNG